MDEYDERAKDAMPCKGCPSISGFWTGRHLDDCPALHQSTVAAALRNAARQERERCAQWCLANLSEGLGQECAEAIRAGEGEG